jgi:hypothetical protein
LEDRIVNWPLRMPKRARAAQGAESTELASRAQTKRR